MDNMKIVRFDIYCKKCKHKDEDDALDPCDICLSEPGRIETIQPTMYEPVED